MVSSHFSLPCGAIPENFLQAAATAHDFNRARDALAVDAARRAHVRTEESRLRFAEMDAVHLVRAHTLTYDALNALTYGSHTCLEE